MATETNIFTPLLKAEVFEKVELLPDGGVKFERRFFWRTARCTMNKHGEVTEFQVGMNWINCLILVLLGFWPIILVILLGLRTKENLREDVKKLVGIQQTS